MHEQLSVHALKTTNDSVFFFFFNYLFSFIGITPVCSMLQSMVLKINIKPKKPT